VETVYLLTRDEVDNIDISFRFICDRSLRSTCIRNGNVYVSNFRECGRKDVYWAELRLDEKDLGSAYIGPVDEEIYFISQNWCKVDYSTWELVKERIDKEFENSSYHKNQVEIMKRRKKRMEEDKAMGFTDPLPIDEFKALCIKHGFEFNIAE
jgi:hypothetical protein